MRCFRDATTGYLFILLIFVSSSLITIRKLKNSSLLTVIVFLYTILDTSNTISFIKMKLESERKKSLKSQNCYHGTTYKKFGNNLIPKNLCAIKATRIFHFLVPNKAGYENMNMVIFDLSEDVIRL